MKKLAMFIALAVIGSIMAIMSIPAILTESGPALIGAIAGTITGELGGEEKEPASTPSMAMSGMSDPGFLSGVAYAATKDGSKSALAAGADAYSQTLSDKFNDPKVFLEALKETDAAGNYVITAAQLIPLHLSRADLIYILEKCVEYETPMEHDVTFSYYQEVWTREDEIDPVSGEVTGYHYEWKKSYPTETIVFTDEEYRDTYGILWPEIFCLANGVSLSEAKGWDNEARIDLENENILRIDRESLDDSIDAFMYQYRWVWNGADETASEDYYSFDNFDPSYRGHTLEETTYTYEETGDWTKTAGTEEGETRTKKKIPAMMPEYIFNDMEVIEYMVSADGDVGSPYPEVRDNRKVEQKMTEISLATFLNNCATLDRTFDFDNYMTSLKVMNIGANAIKHLDGYYRAYEPYREEIRRATVERSSLSDDEISGIFEIIPVDASYDSADPLVGLYIGEEAEKRLVERSIFDEDGGILIWDNTEEMPELGECNDSDIQRDIEAGKYSWEDYSYLVEVMDGEAGTEEGKYAVGCCVRNRVLSPSFPNTYRTVITAPGQFAGHNGLRVGTPPSQAAKKAAVAILKGSVSTIGDAYYFFGRVKGYDMWAEAKKCSYFANRGLNVFYKEFGSVHNMYPKNPSDRVSIWLAHSGKWIYPDGTIWRAGGPTDADVLK